MKLNDKLFLATVASLVILLSACGPSSRSTPPSGHGHHYGQQQGREFLVYIYVDPSNTSQCYADFSQTTLWSAKGQTLRWISDDDGDYLIDFNPGQNGSPFGQSTFPVTKSNDAKSGNPTQSGKYYDYAIRKGTGANDPICKQPSDPGVYVK